MKLYIAGVNHNDPLGRDKLNRWLRRLSTINSEPPAFIATEWDKNHFMKVKKQRKKFRQLLHDTWSSFSTEKLDILEHSLAYEGDTHIEVFPDAEMLWLDEGRQVDESALDEYAEDRLGVMQSLAGGRLLSLDEFSEMAWKRTEDEKKFDDKGRDKKFTDLIFNKLQKSKSDWAIVIVGYNHVRNEPGTMGYLLKEAQVTCETTSLM
jgi:hypothetical protein